MSLVNTETGEVVYAALDSDRTVLYIGRTNDLERRKAEHARSSPWFRLVNEFEVLWRASDSHELADIERILITQEAPPFNVQHGDSKSARLRRDKAWLWLSTFDLNSALFDLVVQVSELEDRIAQLRWGLRQIEQYGGNSVAEAMARRDLPRITPADDALGPGDDAA